MAGRGERKVNTMMRARTIRFVSALILAVSCWLTAGFTAVKAASDPCANASVNPIVCENSKTGTDPSISDVMGGDSSSIMGFSTDISVNVGGTISFKINTTSSKYTLTIYRIGYYQGTGARQIATVTPSAALPQKQPACLSDAATGLIDCGNWAVSASWNVPTNAVSGIYYALVADSNSTASSHIPFIVRDDSSHSDIAFKTNDTTWAAYNDYGGNNLYYGNTSSGCGASGQYSCGRAYKVSYNRPFNLENEGGGYGTSNYLWYAEYPMVRWLEANGYNVSYISTIDVERAPSLLLNHKVILSSGHDEYWSAGERTALTNARDAGVNLAFFTGNDSFWKTRWENSIDGSNTAYRTLVCYKETVDNKVEDPLDPPTWTGTWRDPRFSPPADGGKPENGLLGTIFMVNRGSATPVLTANFSKLRFWRNTAVAGLTGSQTVSLGSETIGYEWNEDLDNGFRPAGLFDLSSTTVSVPELLQDYGNTYTAGTAVHSLTLYRASSGALVFSSGTVQWAWGLDTNHDTNPDTGPATPDVNMQQATVNLLADMQAQPATLQAGLVAATASTDTSAPTSAITSPTSGATVATGTTLTIKGTATDTGGVVAGVEVSVDGGTTWHKATLASAAASASWTYSWTPQAPGSTTIKSRASDDSGNMETPAAGVAVTVSPPTCPCSLFSSTATPAIVATQDASAAELGVKFTSDTGGYINGIKFYKSSANTGTHTGSLWTSTGSLLATGTFTNETASGWQTLTFTTPVAIQANTIYVASYHTTTGYYSSNQGFFTNQYDAWPLHAPAGSNGLYIYGSSQFPTQTYSSTNYWVDVVFNSQFVDTTNPAVASTNPSSGATNAALAAAVSASFNKNVVASSIQFTLTGPNASQIAGTTSYNSTTYTATFTPSSPLTANTTYTATVSGATDSSGNVMKAPYSWSFTTVPPCPCYLFASTATPAVASANDPSAVELGVKFTADINGYINGIRFYKGTSNTGTHVGNLWSSSGQLLATATFTNETASGWQQVLFSQPVAITAGTTYVASYHTNAGNYSYTSSGFASGIDNGDLHAPASGSSGGNGVFIYGGSSQFPNQTYNATNYWVDVVFNTQYVDMVPPSVTSTTPASNALGVSTTIAAITATFSQSVVSSSIQFTLTGPNNQSVAGTATYDDASKTTSFKPSAALAGGATYTATVSGATNQSGIAMSAPYSWSFTTVAPCPCSLFPTSATPATLNAADSSAIEVGMKFTADANGTVTAIRFYKGSNNTGTHIGNLWSSTGQLLATVTFTNETASGWQQATLSTPVAITANTVYVVSYHTNVGNYSVNGAFFTSAVDNTPLHGVSNATSPNGVYAYGNTQFPTQSYNASNYWVDIVFSPS